jgi:hypothetical protein
MDIISWSRNRDITRKEAVLSLASGIKEMYRSHPDLLRVQGYLHYDGRSIHRDK